jgi:hypothetical protein
VKATFFIITVSLFSFSYTTAQSWFQGSVTLTDKLVLTGDVSVDTRYDLVLIKNKDIVDVYPAHRVYAARLYDSKKDINRRYVSIRDQLNPRVFELYEIVTGGEISVLRREVSGHSATIEHEALGFDYYVLFENELIDLSDFNPRVYSKLKEADALLATFVKEHRLNPNISASAVRIIQFFNKRSALSEVVRK